ncbi:Gfo/Idh/MocA family oxidoreductase [Sphingobacterium sp. SGG-5]|uniref:Gfo/Idh/MocA family protein n=1 Tax=Sphingobacterium sp. SGG-5 TaxID=2710881 RepID=UPI0013E9EA58|nr:Gfo/Idh/MocA family oxidoreductase [Sphingobacterium sp. SGG-5]NGM60528.1 Gfo/Idh/MocA family oxidoreductase [Sphingobacterium sp. SGG-5]
MEKKRRDFIKTGSLLGLGALLQPSKLFANSQNIAHANASPTVDKGRPVFNMCGYSAPKIDNVRIGFVGVGTRGQAAVYRMSQIENVTIAALCDLQPDKIDFALNRIKNSGQKPKIYTGEEDWKAVCERDDIDLIYICTHWALHTPVAVYAMQQGKHVCVEVPAATTIDECWQLVETSEATKRHCMMVENCCYDFFELLTLNMARQGFFGEIIHCEGAYIHELTENFTRKNFKWDMWRLKENYERKGNLYPTHGLGPICQVMNINRGDQLDYMVSMSSADFVLGQRVEELAKENDLYKPFAGKDYRGNMNTSIIKTHKGKTIMLQHDVSSLRPYSRIHLISGTKGIAQKYPLPGRISTHHRNWFTEEQMKEVEEKYQPAIVKKIGELAKKVGGHGGMDFLMDWRTIDCLRNGLPLDQDVYDAALWSCIFPLSETSVNNRSQAVDIPDFTRGGWKKNTPVDISLSTGGNTGVKDIRKPLKEDFEL